MQRSRIQVDHYLDICHHEQTMLSLFHLENRNPHMHADEYRSRR